MYCARLVDCHYKAASEYQITSSATPPSMAHAFNRATFKIQAVIKALSFKVLKVRRRETNVCSDLAIVCGCYFTLQFHHRLFKPD